MGKTIWTFKGLRRDCFRKETVPAQGCHGEGMRSVPDGYEMADVELAIDLESIAKRMGVKAMKNKSGKASMMWGLVTVKVTRRQRVGASE